MSETIFAAPQLRQLDHFAQSSGWRLSFSATALNVAHVLTKTSRLRASQNSILRPFWREQPRPVSVYPGCTGVVRKGVQRRVWPRSGQEAEKSRLANGVAPPQGHLQSHNTSRLSPPHTNYGQNKTLVRYLTRFSAVRLAVVRSREGTYTSNERTSPAWREKKQPRAINQALLLFLSPFFSFVFFWMDATHPEYNGVEEEDEFEEHIGESVAVADVVVVWHGAARECWPLARLRAGCWRDQHFRIGSLAAPASARPPDGCTAVVIKTTILSDQC